jgi:FKBP-type peptidyl-prolyl cis-trans isomerase SlyD
MKITPQCVVALTWTLKDTLGEVLDELDEPVEFLLGGKDLLAGIEEALQGHEAGDKIELHLEPENAFGDYDENLVFFDARSIFPAELEEGMTFDGAAMPAGSSTQLPLEHIYTVTEIYPEHVVLDGNHPLAGMAIRLSARVESVREATEQEVGQGSLGTGFFRLEPIMSGNDTRH